MLNLILRYGLIAGLIVGIPMMVLAVALNGHPPLAWGMVIGYTTMLVAFSMVFIAIKRHRDNDLGGVIRFWPAFALGLGISFVASVIYVAAWEAVMALTHMDFASSYAATLIEEQKAKGASADALAKLTAEMETFKVQYANPLFRLPMTFTEIFPIGLLVSLITAGLLRNRRFLAVRRG
ncbi:MAG: DUF4199 domain-containing protein [Proteobacteria bacterium]|uniref:DUF4199 domain-containing protein n=1 Tax=Rudaea sp. TaxID=2136325 RepID=UPI001DD1805B|nr:DUF4199 domain-containing protein [Pseudomonadota bacterium]MBS0568617.1 DUF4199 domain-containing protein [Pseudomonadota bacterium]